MKIKWSSLFIGLYAWLTAVFFGAVLMDVLYASFLGHQFEISQITPVFSDISDMLLRLGVFLIGSGFLAVGFTWQHAKARNFLIASLLVYFFEFSLPMVFPYLKTSVGPFWIRLLIVGAATLLAFIGQYFEYHQRPV